LDRARGGEKRALSQSRWGRKEKKKECFSPFTFAVTHEKGGKVLIAITVLKGKRRKGEREAAA